MPVVAFSVIEDRYGIVAGLIAGMVFGVGEIVWERVSAGRVSAMTWAGNGLVLILGAVSLFTGSGIWFKLQPSLIEGVMAVVLWGSVLVKRPLLVEMARKQGAPVLEIPIVFRSLRGFTLRLGIFFAAHAILAAWAALHWSTAAWAALKGIGFTLTMILYGVAESAVLRYRIAQLKTRQAKPHPNP